MEGVGKCVGLWGGVRKGAGRCVGDVGGGVGKCVWGVGRGVGSVLGCGEWGKVWGGMSGRCVKMCLGCGEMCLGCGERCSKSVGVGAM